MVRGEGGEGERVVRGEDGEGERVGRRERGSLPTHSMECVTLSIAASPLTYFECTIL